MVCCFMTVETGKKDIIAFLLNLHKVFGMHKICDMVYVVCGMVYVIWRM